MQNLRPFFTSFDEYRIETRLFRNVSRNTDRKTTDRSTMTAILDDSSLHYFVPFSPRSIKLSLSLRRRIEISANADLKFRGTRRNDSFLFLFLFIYFFVETIRNGRRAIRFHIEVATIGNSESLLSNLLRCLTLSLSTNSRLK